VLNYYNRCLGATTDERGIKLRLALAIRAEKLIPTPWEYLHDGESFLLKRGQSIVRIIEGLRPRQAPFSPVRRLLVAIANPKSKKYHQFDAEEHERELKERIKKLPGVEVDWLVPATRDALRNKLRDTSYDALYFVGHGCFDQVLGGQIILEKPVPKRVKGAVDGKKRRATDDLLNADILAQWLSNARAPDAYASSTSTPARPRPPERRILSQVSLNA